MMQNYYQYQQFNTGLSNYRAKERVNAFKKKSQLKRLTPSKKLTHLQKNYNKEFYKLHKIDLDWSEKYAGTPGQLTAVLRGPSLPSMWAINRSATCTNEINNCCGTDVQ